MPTTFTVTQGVLNTPETIAVIARSEYGGYADAAGQFGDAPALACELAPGDGRPSAGSLAVSWVTADDADSLLLVQFIPTVIDALEPGSYRALVTVAETREFISEFVLTVLPGIGTTLARPVYCTYGQLVAELSWLAQLEDPYADQTGFAEARADARDWVDQIVLNAAPAERGHGVRSYSWGWSWGEGTLRRRYAEALESNGLDVTSIEGRRIAKAAVYKSLSTILARCVGTTATGSDLIALARSYEAKADAEILCCTAHFPGAGLRPLNLSVARRRR